MASLAFAGYPAVAVPIMPGLSMNPPAAQFNVSQLPPASLPALNLLNFQFITGEVCLCALRAPGEGGRSNVCGSSRLVRWQG